jgi:hypothetical protein
MDEKLCAAIREAVRDGIDDALTKYGIDISNPNLMQADMLYLRKSRQGSEEIIKWAKRSCVAATASGFLLALWHGIKQLINGV